MPRSPGFGAVILAAYKPQPELFRRQLLSIQRQSHTEFHCLIAADGDPGDVRQLVERIVGDDSRFRVIGFDDNVGFYRNFERALAACPEEARWVALSDQDDEWFPGRLSILLPALERTVLASCQARVVAYPSGETIAASTSRRNVSPAELVLDNQFTGAFCVFRRELLERALPFPVWHGPTAAHDHWLGLVATFSGGARVLDDVLQNYVQHDRNVMGENTRDTRPISIAQSFKNVATISRRYEGGARPAALLRTVYKTVVGWREAMVSSLVTRVPDSNDLRYVERLFGARHDLALVRTFLNRQVESGAVPSRTRTEFLVGCLAGALSARPIRKELTPGSRPARVTPERDST